MLGGVCAGIAAHWRVDVTLVRIVTVVLALCTGVGVLAYAAIWLLTPGVDEPAPLDEGGVVRERLRDRGPHRRHRLLPILLAALLIWVILTPVRGWWWGSPPPTSSAPIGGVLFILLLVVLLGTRLGRWSLGMVAVLIALAIAATAVFGSSFGSRVVTVGNSDDLQPSYDYGTGSLRMDLTGITAVNGEQQTEIHLGRGSVRVALPAGVPVLVKARAGIGSVSIRGHRVSGVDAAETVPLAGADTATNRIVLDITVGAGSVDVR